MLGAVDRVELAEDLLEQRRLPSSLLPQRPELLEQSLEELACFCVSYVHGPSLRPPSARASDPPTGTPVAPAREGELEELALELEARADHACALEPKILPEPRRRARRSRCRDDLLHEAGGLIGNVGQSAYSEPNARDGFFGSMDTMVNQ